MPIPTPFHPVTSVLCKSNDWREWSGYLAAVTYEHTHEREYFAIRNSAALIDVTPLFKYDILGPQAETLVDRIIPRNITSCTIGQILYTPWCDDDGKVIDDGTVWRLGQNRFRITAADPSLRWFQDCGYGLEAEVIDVSESVAAVAIQGPSSREILLRAAGAEALDTLPFYHLTEGEIGGAPVFISRTGYTGDLGYEIWLDPVDAVTVWKRLMTAGTEFGLMPAGLAALDLAPQVAGRASRNPAPVYQNGKQIGQATSMGFSPLLKKYIALASLKRRHAALGSRVELEMTVEYQRNRVPARIVRKPFYDPPHKRSDSPERASQTSSR